LSGVDISARVLMSRPRVLLIDEPSAGLAPKVVSDLFQTVRQLKEEMRGAGGGGVWYVVSTTDGFAARRGELRGPSSSGGPPRGAGRTPAGRGAD
jgi:predicted ABC-type transport system involved in lysophospholipase L1 biosynthesis ATPase subunit